MVLQLQYYSYSTIVTVLQLQYYSYSTTVSAVLYLTAVYSNKYEFKRAKRQAERTGTVTVLQL